MRKADDQGGRFHQRIWELLPWYANGSLDGREQEMVESHLAACPRCREEALTCQRTAEAVKSAGETAPSPHPVQLQRVLARIEASEQERRAGAGWKARLRGLAEATPGPLRRALAAQAAVILVLLGLLVWREMRPQRAPAEPVLYSTLSAPAEAPAPKAGLRLMFSPQATERQIRALLAGIQGQITAGPSPLGVYTVEVPAAGDPIAVVLARLRSEPEVVFAEPAAGGTGNGTQ